MKIVKRGICRSFNESHYLEAGSVIEEIQNCHIGNYMEGYLTHGNEFCLCFYCSSEPSLLLFCVDYERALSTPLIIKNY